MQKKTLSILTLILSFNILSGQYSNFLHLSTDKGLSSSEIYCQLQDSMGYMWFGTSRGLSRYDGYRFENFTASDGLPSNSIIKLFYDKGTLWISTYDGSLSYYKDNKFHIFAQNDTILKISENYYTNNLFTDHENNLWIIPQRGGIYKLKKDGEIKKYETTSDYSGLFFKEIDDGIIYEYITSSKKSDSIYLKINSNGYFVVGIQNGFRKNVKKINNGEYLISISNKLYHIKNNEIYSTIEYQNDISGIFIDNKNNLWISVLFEGAYCYPNIDLKNLPEIYMNGMSPIQIHQDNQSGYWLPTTENGIFYTPSFQFTSYDRFGIPPFNIISLKIAFNTLYFSTFDQQVIKCSIDNHRIMSIQNLQLSTNKDNLIQDIVATDDSIIWYIGKELLKEKNNKITKVCNLSRTYSAFARKNKVYLSSNNGLSIYEDTTHTHYKKENLPISNAIFADDNGVWIGTINGLYKFNEGKYTFLGDTNKLLKSRINDISKSGKYIVVATNGDGLYFYNPNNNYLQSLNTANGLNSNFVNTIFVSENNIWAGTNKGLNKINIIDKDDSLTIFTTHFCDIDGLYTAEIKDIAQNNNCLFLGTTKGLISFYPENLKKNTHTPLLHFDSILVNNKKLPIDTFYRFTANQNTISFYYKGTSFSAGNKVKYKYKLQGYDNEWNYTSDRLLRFPNLQAGEYTLLLTASNDKQIWNTTPLKISFYIEKKFTKTILFYILLAITLFLTAAGILSIRYYRIDKDLQVKKQMLKSEQKALRSQMNPHFIFNALNSIRRYILENDTDNADFYLTSFASLMRKVLDNSQFELINLEDEINTLKLYLELEKMRFDKSFSFKLITDEKINLSSTFLPTMIIQPIVENAIWHGLAPLKENGLLTIEFIKINKKSFLCIVDDNGIGRKKAKETTEKRKNHKSTGIKNLQERIKLINDTGIRTITYNTIDKYDTENNAQGTKVEITFKHSSQKNKPISIKIFGKKHIIKINKKSKK